MTIRTNDSRTRTCTLWLTVIILVYFMILLTSVEKLHNIADDILLPKYESVSFPPCWATHNNMHGLASPKMTPYWRSLQIYDTDDLFSQAWMILPPLSNRRFYPYYNHLHLSLSVKFLDGSFARTIHETDDILYHREKDAQLSQIDAETTSNELGGSSYEDQEYPNKSGCYRPKWCFDFHPTCQIFHEQTLERTMESSGIDMSYMGRLNLRLSWLFENRASCFEDHHEEFVLKAVNIVNNRVFNHRNFLGIQSEAVLMDRTAESLRTSNIYGYCGSSIAMERGFSFPDALLPSYNFYNSTDIAHPVNLLSIPQKLKIAHQMTEGLAELRGNPWGVIVIDEFQMQQWNIDRSGNVKLNDMHNAKALPWNFDRKQYCPIKANFQGLFRPPEVNRSNRKSPTDDSADVYALGQIFYSLLTGLVPFYERQTLEDAIDANRRGQIPYLADQYRNSKSVVGRRFVSLMERMWQPSPLGVDRPNIFEVLNDLKETVRLYERMNPQGEKIADISLFNLPLITIH